MCHFVLVKWEKKFCPVSLHSRHIWLFLNMLLTNYQGRGGCQSKATDLLWNGLWQKNWRRQIFCYFYSGNNIKPWRRVCGLLFWIYWHHPMQFVIRKKSRANINLSLVLKGRPLWPNVGLTHLDLAWCHTSEYWGRYVKDSIYWDLSLISSIFSPGLDFKQNQMIPSNIMSQNGDGRDCILFLPTWMASENDNQYYAIIICNIQVLRCLFVSISCITERCTKNVMYEFGCICYFKEFL